MIIGMYQNSVFIFGNFGKKNKDKKRGWTEVYDQKYNEVKLNPIFTQEYVFTPWNWSANQAVGNIQENLHADFKVEKTDAVEPEKG